jgi:hypothetical protein
MIPLAIFPGIFGWGVLGLLFYLLASIPAVAAWYLTYDPSVRYLIPIYPLYALFAVEGLRRLTRSFAGRWGALAGGALAAAAVCIPVPFLTSAFDLRVAAGVLSREEGLAARLPEYPLFRYMGPQDTVIIFGGYDRFHCPAQIVYRSGWYPVNRWGNDPDRWRQELTRYHITYLLVRDEARDRVSLIQSLQDRLEQVDRRGRATLYRVASEPKR